VSFWQVQQALQVNCDNGKKNARRDCRALQEEAFVLRSERENLALDAHRDAHAAADAQRGKPFFASRFCISCSSVTSARARPTRRSDGRWRSRRH
jgi:hypothetical protein